MPLSLPEPDRTQLPRSPLEVVVAQVRHENRLAASESSTARAVHEALGGSDGSYPFIDGASAAVMLNLVVAGPGVSAPAANTESQLTGWRLHDAENTWAVTLMPDHFALETTRYTTWAEFGPRLVDVIDAVSEHVAPAFEQRLGLRYIDRLRDPVVSEIAGWRPYIRREVLGILCHPDLGDAVVGAQQQVLFTLDDGVTGTLRHGPIRDPEGKAVQYLLDYDVFRQGGRPFARDAIRDTFDSFNTAALQLFQATVTPELLDYLGS
jgi:uncharacterized protein (TIGR04255 family)